MSISSRRMLRSRSPPSPACSATTRTSTTSCSAPSLVSPPAHGTLTLGQDGAFAYVPAPEYSGADAFTYVTIDAHGLSSGVATVSLDIEAVNDLPEVHADAYEVDED